LSESGRKLYGVCRKKTNIQQSCQGVCINKEIISVNTAFVYKEQDTGTVSKVMGSAKKVVIVILSDKIRNKVTGMIITTDINEAYSDKCSREKKHQRQLSVTRRTLRFIINRKILIKANIGRIHTN